MKKTFYVQLCSNKKCSNITFLTALSHICTLIGLSSLFPFASLDKHLYAVDSLALSRYRVFMDGKCYIGIHDVADGKLPE